MERPVLIHDTLLQQMLKWVLSHVEEQHDPARKTVKAFSLCSPWGSTVSSICLKRFYLLAPTAVLELEYREKAAFGVNLSLSEFGWDETKKGK